MEQIIQQVSDHFRRDTGPDTAECRKIFQAGYEPALIDLQANALQVPHLLVRQYQLSRFLDRIDLIRKALTEAIPDLRMTRDEVPLYCAGLDLMFPEAESAGEELPARIRDLSRALVRNRSARKALLSCPQALFYAVDRVCHKLYPDRDLPPLYAW